VSILGDWGCLLQCGKETRANDVITGSREAQELSWLVSWWSWWSHASSHKLAQLSFLQISWSLALFHAKKIG